MDRFPVITISGTTPAELGTSHGTQLRDRVRRTVEFYLLWFTTQMKLEEQALHATADLFAQALRGFQGGRYAEEITAIASAAGLEPWLLFMLNARTEIVNSSTGAAATANECTSLCCPTHSLLAQNWDWAQELEDLTVVLRIETPERPTILMIAEPGMLGKIGLNAAGVGVCLNLLKPRSAASQHTELAGVPVHVLLRVVLDSSSLECAVEAVADAPRGWASTSVLHCAGSGAAACIELEGAEMHVYRSSVAPLLRTNHFSDGQTLGTPSSVARLERGLALMGAWGEAGGDADAIRNLLADQLGPAGLPICRPFAPDSVLGVDVGTVTTIVVDLEQRTLSYTPGSPLKNAFSTVTCDMSPVASVPYYAYT